MRQTSHSWFRQYAVIFSNESHDHDVTPEHDELVVPRLILSPDLYRLPQIAFAVPCRNMNVPLAYLSLSLKRTTDVPWGFLLRPWPCSPSVNPERIPLSSESWDPVYHILTISCSHNVSGSCWNLPLSLSMSFPGKPGSVNNPSVWAITIRTITYCGNEGVVIIWSCPSWYRKKYCLSGCYMKVIHTYWPIGLENAAALRYIQYTWSVSQTEDN